jgi:hypothetical protein
MKKRFTEHQQRITRAGCHAPGDARQTVSKYR